MFKKIYFYSRLCLSDMIISVDTGTCAMYISHLLYMCDTHVTSHMFNGTYITIRY